MEKISYDFEDEGKLSQFSGEGRTITVEFDKFIFICCYVPNSGEGNVFLLTRLFCEYINCFSVGRVASPGLSRR